MCTSGATEAYCSLCVTSAYHSELREDMCKVLPTDYDPNCSEPSSFFRLYSASYPAILQLQVRH